MPREDDKELNLIKAQVNDSWNQTFYSVDDDDSDDDNDDDEDEAE